MSGDIGAFAKRLEGEAAQLIPELPASFTKAEALTLAESSVAQLLPAGVGRAWADAYAHHTPQIVLSAVILLGFFAVTALVLLKQADPNSILVGGFLAMATTVVMYWFGTTPASSRKSDQLMQLATMVHGSVPADIVTAVRAPQVPENAQ